jgi:hypothetical protein
VWFGAVDDVMAVGEGLETVLSVRTAVPAMPIAAALSSGHLGVFRPPHTLRRLYIAQDNDPAGQLAVQKLSRSALCVGIEPVVLTPTLKDFNDDLRQFGVDALRTALRAQLCPEDADRFMALEAGNVGGDAVPLQPNPVTALPREGRARGPARGRSDGRRAGAATAGGGYFPPPERRAVTEWRGSEALRLCIARQNSRRPPSFAALRPQERRSPARPPSGDRRRPRRARPLPHGGHHHDDRSRRPIIPHRRRPLRASALRLASVPGRARSASAARGPAIGGAVADIVDALVATLQDTRLEPDLDDLLWAAVNLFHRAGGRVARELDDNEVAQKRSQKEQDGSEIRSVELERLVAEGLTFVERRDAMEIFRDHAADLYERTPVRPGARAPARRSTTAPSPPPSSTAATSSPQSAAPGPRC